jgi:hypothetical protein
LWNYAQNSTGRVGGGADLPGQTVVIDFVATGNPLAARSEILAPCAIGDNCQGAA